MKKLLRWLKRKWFSAALAMSSVEKEVLNQNRSQSYEDASRQERRHTQGTLFDSLLRGELTDEVKDLRWRMYKTLANAEKMRHVPMRPVSVQDTGRVDTSGPNYPVEMVHNNHASTRTVSDALENDLLAETVMSGDTSNYNISAKDYFASVKLGSTIRVLRDYFPRFLIENYTQKLNVRKVNGTLKSLEFCISKYPDQYNVNTTMFLTEIKKVLDGTLPTINSFDIKEIGFVTDNTLGAKDLLFFGYKILGFDKVVEFEGYYVVKFNAQTTIDGQNLVKDYARTELDLKYENNEAKKRRV